MKTIMVFLIIGTLLLSGCSYSANNIGSAVPNTSTTMNQYVQMISFQPGNDRALEDLVTEEKEMVYWSHKEIQNLERLDEFIYHVSQNIKDEVRVETNAKDPLLK